MTGVMLLAGIWVGAGGASCQPQDTCTGDFNLALTTDRFQIFASNSTDQQALLSALAINGQPPYEYSWSVLGPSGESADELLDAPNAANPQFTPGQQNGHYELYCTVTDANGCSATARIVLTVGNAVGLDLSTARFGVLAGGGEKGSTTIHLKSFGGTAPHTITWLVTAPDGTIDNDRLDPTDPFEPVFTSCDQVGTYVLTATITDSLGATFTQSVIVLVGQDLGLDVVTSKTIVLPNGGDDGSAMLLATPIGGKEPYSYDWEVTGPNSQTQSDLLTDTTVRSPTFVSGDLTGMFLIRCAVTDAEGTVMIGSTTITVGQQLAIDVSADRVALVPDTAGANKAVLSAEVRGGREPVTLDWSATDAFGHDAVDLLDATSGSQVTFTATGTAGNYVVRCAATDADNVMTFDSVQLTVGTGLGVVVTADKVAVAASGTLAARSAQLTATVHGYQVPFQYEWDVIDPNGDHDLTRLTDSSTSTSIFVAGSAVGTYSVFCTVTDVSGTSATDSVRITVGQPLNADVTVDRQALVINGGVAGQAQLITTINGGVMPYTYQWSVVAPTGVADPTRLSDVTIAAPIFTSSTSMGTYRLTLTVSDMLGTVFTDSLELIVGSVGGAGQAFSGDVGTTRQILLADGTTATITASALGGTIPITYTWTVTDPDGATDNSRLDATTGASVTFTSSTALGTYLISVAMADAAGATFNDSVHITVTAANLVLNLTADDTYVRPSGSVALTADVLGGETPFDYTWSAVDSNGSAAGAFSSGSTGTGTATQNNLAGNATNIWSTSTTGTYTITCTVTDNTGATFSNSLPVVVAAYDLALNLTADDAFIRASTAVTLTADAVGGDGPFDYSWSAAASSGAAAGTFTSGSTGVGTAAQDDLAGDGTNTWSVTTTGTYTITCTVTDSGGVSFSDSISIAVTTESLSMDLAANDTTVTPFTAVTLASDVLGGDGPYDYTWYAVDSSGAAAGTFISGSTGVGQAAQNNVAGDAANSWSVATTGTFTITCRITDNIGTTFNDSVSITVASAALVLDLTANDTFVSPSTAVTLSANVLGGNGPFDYAWSAVNSSDIAAGTFTTGSTGVGTAAETDVAGNASNGWSATTTNTYTITCTVTDDSGTTFHDSIMIVVTQLDMFSMALTANRAVVWPSETVILYADRLGGSTPYTYTWSATDEAGASAGTFGAVTQSGIAGNTTNTWQAPLGGDGTYRIACTVRDALSNEFTDSVCLEVSALAIQNVFIDPVDSGAPAAILLAATTFTAASAGGAPGQILAGVANPAHPRNIVVTVTNDIDNSISGGTARITGLDARGQSQVELITISPSAGTTSTNTGVYPFAVITEVALYDINGLDIFAINEKVALAVGNKFGLTGLIDSAADVRYVSEGGTVLTAGYTVDATVGQQGITFANAPNGARDYTVVFRTR